VIKLAMIGLAFQKPCMVLKKKLRILLKFCHSFTPQFFVPETGFPLTYSKPSMETACPVQLWALQAQNENAAIFLFKGKF
jgi:hypothetical protein